jgi:hypothetical protein
MSPRRHALLLGVRYALPAVLVIAGFAILIAVESSNRWEGFAMCVGAGLAVALMNVLFRLGAKGDEERDAEESARDFLTEHGHWPDEPPRG